MPKTKSISVKLSITMPILFALLGTVVFAQQSKVIEKGKGSYESERETHKIDVKDVKRLQIESSGGLGGTITVRSITREPSLKFYHRYKARSVDEALEFSKHISVETRRSTDDLVIEAAADRDSPWQETDQSARLYLEIGVPGNVEVAVNCSFFDVEVYGPFKRVEIRDEMGAIRVLDVNGQLSVSTSNSPVHIEGITGSIDVQTSNSAIRAVNINSGTESRARFRNEYGLIDVSGLTGSIDCATSYAAIDLRGAKLLGGSSAIASTYGAIDAEIVSFKNAQLAVSNVFSNVEILLPENLKSRFELKVARGGRIHMEGIAVTADLMDTESLIAETEGPDSEISVDISGIGTISIRGEKFR